MSPTHRSARGGTAQEAAAPPPTQIESPFEPRSLSEAGQRLRDAVTASQRAAIDEAVVEAVAASRKQGRRTYWLSLIGAFLLAVAISLPFSLISYFNSQQAASDAGALRAGDAASAEVTNARSSSLLTVRRDFTNANNALLAAGLAPVTDPGNAASAYQIAIGTGEALGTLRAIGELQKRGAVQVPGVSAPDPGTDRFPSP